MVAHRRIGVLGGTFDPVHIGHLIVAEEARVRLGLERVLFVPARVSPHKLDEEPCDAEHRWRMVELAIAGNPHFEASRMELDRRGPSYTVDTLVALRKTFGPGCELHFIMGVDALEGLQRWRDPERILALARIVAVTRPGHDLDVDALARALPGLPGRLEVLATLQIGISATDLRERARRGLPIRYQVPEEVEAYIREHGLYRSEPAPEAAAPEHRPRGAVGP